MARRRIVLIDPSFMARILRADLLPHGAWITALTSDAPRDIRVIGCGWDERTNTVRFAVESEEFDDVPDGQFAPEWRPMFTVHSDPMTRYEAAMTVLRPSAP